MPTPHGGMPIPRPPRDFPHSDPPLGETWPIGGEAVTDRTRDEDEEQERADEDEAARRAEQEAERWGEMGK